MRKAARSKAERDAEKLHLALAWPAETEPTPVTIERGESNKWHRLWWVAPARELGSAIGQGVTDGYSHARSSYTDEQLANRYGSKVGSYLSFSQGVGDPWYNTEREALLAYYWSRARHAAEHLAAIKRRIDDG